MMQIRKMNKERLIQNCLQMIGGDANQAKVEQLIASAFAFINWYTFQSYSIDHVVDVPIDVLSIVVDLVAMKYHDVGNVIAEKLSDYSVTYSNEDLSEKMRPILNRYVIYYVS